MLSSSFSLAWSAQGQLWKNKTTIFFSYMLSLANQIEVLDKPLLCFMPAAIRGGKQPSHHKQVATTSIFILPWCDSQFSNGERGRGKKKDGEPMRGQISI